MRNYEYSLNDRSRQRDRSGFTLLEVLIATVVTLLMMLSLAAIFKSIGDSMKQGRSALALNSTLRNIVMRLDRDLENLTVSPNKLMELSASRNGYFKYYDGSLTDYSAAFYSDTLPGDAAGIENLSRFGDLDDIIMFTSHASDDWFWGKIPFFVLEKKVAPDLVTDRNGNGNPDDLELVTIASQHAEIAIFCEPDVAAVSSGGSANLERDTSIMVADPTQFADVNADGFPDSFRLHYRVLPIRPDLNLPTGVLGNSPDGNWLTAGPNGTLPSPLCDMAKAHAQCDLSIRRVSNPAGGRDFIAANSLEDLENPANRFAHVVIPISGSSTTMPLLALGPSLTLAYDRSTAITNDIADPDGLLGGSAFRVGSGFLHPAYTLNSFWDGPTGITAAKVGEDVALTKLLAFDVKGFDPQATLVTTTAGLLSPNDPGYARDIVTAAATSFVPVGEYVDLGWARKTAKALTNFGRTLADVPATVNLWSPLSGYDPRIRTSGPAFTDFLYRSGQVVESGARPAIMQMAYDTYTSTFERDSVMHAQTSGVRGVMRILGSVALYTDATWRRLDDSWRVITGPSFLTDAGTDGIDNNAFGGVDDITEMETSMPFPVELRGIKISFRIEDPAARRLEQMSLIKEFVTK